MITLPRMNMNKRRVWIITSIVAVVAILIGVYAWWSVQTWRQYDSSWHAAQSSVKRNIAKATGVTPASDEEYAEKRSALSQVTDTLKKYEHMCTTNTLVGWQKALHAVEVSVRACEEAQAKHEALKLTLTKVNSYLGDEQTLQKELVKLMPTNATSLDEKHWAAYATAATDVQKELNTLKLGDDSASLLSTAKKQLAALATAWKAFNEAHKKEDRSAWQKAKGELVRAYAGIPAIADSSDKTLEALLKELSTASRAL